ncbi:MAG: dockerin type I domain-containing protein, partial [Dehalococcoidia bacterium]|nr:dockerin type I domain-containing protein [Dehalococcoidia bacterium]
QPQADEFSSELDGANSLVHDGDGLNSDCPTADPLGLGEEPASDNLDALTAEDASFVDPDLDGVLDEPVFFSLAPGSPSLTPPRDPSDVLWTAGFSPGIYAAGDALGLQAGDDIDGLCVADESPGAPTYEPGSDTVLFSLAAGSPTLTSLGASAADVLAPGPSVRYTAAQLGLQAGDDLDALACGDIAGEVVTVLVGDIWFCSEEFQGGVCDTKVNVGDTVEWDFTPSANIHSTTECGASCDDPTDTPLWDSGVIGPASPDRTFDYTFNEPGVYLYYCTVHPTQQRGRIIVNEPGGLIGDVNCDGLINAIDAALILQLGAGIIDELPCPQNADTNEDGMINAVDAALILQFVAGIIDSLPP